MSLYVDGSLVATAADTTGNLENADNITLGSYADGSEPVDVRHRRLLQATRAVLTPSQFLPSSYVPPQTLPAPTTPANNVLNLPGLAFYLPPYDDRHYFADLHESDPLLMQPVREPRPDRPSTRRASTTCNRPRAPRCITKATPTVGSYWSSQAGLGWTVANSNGTQSPTQNFDFVQNSETFTISDVFNVPSVPTNGDLVLVGNNSNSSALPGFDLSVDSGGDLELQHYRWQRRRGLRWSIRIWQLSLPATVRCRS